MKQTKEEILESGVIHFSIGEDTGILLMNIAQEHIKYNYDPEKALRSIQQSLMGCPTDIALQIIRGDLVLFVENKEIIATDRTPENDVLFPSLDISKWVEDKIKGITETADGVGNGNESPGLIKMLQNIDDKDFKVDVLFKDVIKYIKGDKDIFRGFIEDEPRITELGHLLMVAKQFIEDSIKIYKVIKWVEKMYPDDMKGIDTSFNTLIFDVKTKLDIILEDRFALKTRQEIFLETYMESQKKIDVISESGLTPVDIFESYSAGYLSPDGTYYGLNGEIANMLHNQLEDMLEDFGVIPPEDEREDSAGGWLEKNGWIRQHGNHIQYAGYGFHKRDLGKLVPMTQTQIEIISDFGQRCHDGILRVGMTMVKISAIRLKMIDEFQIRNYFEF